MNIGRSAQSAIRGQKSTRVGGVRRAGLLSAIGIALAAVALAAAVPSVVDAQRRIARGHGGVVEVPRRYAVRMNSDGRKLSTYDSLVLSQKPVMFLSMDTPSSGSQRDATGHGHTGTYFPSASKPGLVRMPNGDAVAVFNGRTQYLEVPDSTALSVPKTGVLTISAWIRPDTLQFPAQEGTGYVNYLGKSEYAHVNQCEYELRMYSKTNFENPVRPNRLSAYAFNLPGGLGSGSYVQDPMSVGGWIMVTEVINTRVKTPTAPTGYVTIFKNGVLRKTVALNQFNVTPAHGTAPFRVGSVELHSYFMGAIGKVAAFDYELSPAQVAAQYAAMAR